MTLSLSIYIDYQLFNIGNKQALTGHSRAACRLHCLQNLAEAARYWKVFSQSGHSRSKQLQSCFSGLLQL